MWMNGEDALSSELVGKILEVLKVIFMVMELTKKLLLINCKKSITEMMQGLHQEKPVNLSDSTKQMKIQYLLQCQAKDLLLLSIA